MREVTLPVHGNKMPGSGDGKNGLEDLARQAEIKYLVIAGSVEDPHHFDADLNSTYYPDADLDPDPSLKAKAQTLEKVLK
jgi:hypothetical protein